MSETKFYIELPADEHGNTAYPPAVVEARYHPAGRVPLRPLDNTERPCMTVLAPREIASRWPSWYTDSYGGFTETEGPARILTRDEYDTIIGRIRADR
jgi:hypothetical protein